jgi:predicted nucleic acid-binding protein
LVAIILDTGVIIQHFSKDPPKQIQNLFKSILNQYYETHVLLATLCEVEFHLIKKYDQDSARALLISFTKQFPIIKEELNDDLIIKTGLLKYQNNSVLSYIDCMLLACALNKKWTIHSTEDFASKIPIQIKNKITLVKYDF